MIMPRPGLAATRGYPKLGYLFLEQDSLQVLGVCLLLLIKVLEGEDQFLVC